MGGGYITMPNQDRIFGDYKDDDNRTTMIVVIVLLLIAVVSIYMAATGQYKSDRCQPYYSGDELVNDC